MERPEFKGSYSGGSTPTYCELEVTSSLQSKSILSRGLRNIQIYNTARQKNSEDIHIIYTIRLVMRSFIVFLLFLGINSVDTSIAAARFVDLAGCEPQKVQNNRGQLTTLSKRSFVSMQMLIKCVAQVVEAPENEEKEVIL